jgi:hypothetical protein
LTNKPAVLADNIIDWNEINNRPDVQVLADNINYILNNYSLATHSHSSLYSPLSHNHNSTYSSLSHTHSQYSTTSHNHALSALTDTTFTSLTSNQLMRFDGTKWINFSPDYAPTTHTHSWDDLNGISPDDKINASATNTNGSVVKRDSAGDVFCRLIRQEYIGTNAQINFITTQRSQGVGVDNYSRQSTPSQFRTAVTDDYYAPVSHTHSVNDITGTWTIFKASNGSWQNFFQIKFISAAGYVVYEIDINMFRDSLDLDSRASHRRYIVKIYPQNTNLVDLSLISFYDRGTNIQIGRVVVNSTTFNLQSMTEDFRVYLVRVRRLFSNNVLSESVL